MNGSRSAKTSSRKRTCCGSGTATSTLFVMDVRFARGRARPILRWLIGSSHFSQHIAASLGIRELPPFTVCTRTLEADLDGSFSFLLKRLSIDGLTRFDKSEFVVFLGGIFDAGGTICLHQKRLGVALNSHSQTRIWGCLITFQESFAWLHAGYHPIVDSRVQDPSRLGYYKEGRVLRLVIWRKAQVCRTLSWITPRHGEKKVKAQFGREICGLAICPGERRRLTAGAQLLERYA